MRMTGVFLLDGAVPSDLGWVVVCSPPAWLFSPGERPVMTAPAVDPFALKTLMRGRSETVFEDYLFRRVRTSVGYDVVISDRNGKQIVRPGSTAPLRYRFTDPDEASWWDSHIAPTVLCSDRGGQPMVVDPEIAEGPVGAREWRSLQDPLGVACLLNIAWSGSVSIDQANSSKETLDAMRDANSRLNGDECTEADLVSFLTDGEILCASFDNPYAFTMVDGRKSVSHEQAFMQFGEWLAPLAAFKRWREEAKARLRSEGDARIGTTKSTPESGDVSHRMF